MKAFAYLRTSSAANVGADKDSDKRQRAAILAYAEANAIEIRGEYYDAAVSGSDPVLDRPEFVRMLEAIAGNGVRAILVESPDRFARDVLQQIVGHEHLKTLGIELIPTTAPTFFTEDTPTAVLIRQILGAVSQWEKANLVMKLAAARKRSGRQGGRPKPPAEVSALARSLWVSEDCPMSLRRIGRALAAKGYLSVSGGVYSPQSVKAMLKGS